MNRQYDAEEGHTSVLEVAHDLQGLSAGRIGKQPLSPLELTVSKTA